MTANPRRALAALLVLLLASGCAVMQEEHRNVIEFLDDELAPGPAAARVALAPLAIPVGVGAYVVDSFVVNPVRMADDAWFDMVELLWESQEEETTFRRVLIAPFALIASPVIWAGDWVARILLPVPSRSDLREPEPPEPPHRPRADEPEHPADELPAEDAP